MENSAFLDKKCPGRLFHRIGRKSGMESGPDFRQVMVVVFGDEVEMVNESHGLLETWM
jgi:hypothetical protein